MPIVTVTYLGTENTYRVLIPQERPFSDFVINYFSAQRQLDRHRHRKSVAELLIAMPEKVEVEIAFPSKDYPSPVDKFYRTADLLSVLDSNPQLEQRYQKRRQRILQNPRETVSFWGGGYATDPKNINELEGATELEATPQTPKMFTGEELRQQVFSFDETKFRELMAEAGKPTLKEFILEVPGADRGRDYYTFMVGNNKIGYLEDALNIQDGVLQVTNGKPMGLFPTISLSDNPYTNDTVVMDVSGEAQMEAAAKFSQFMEEYVRTSPHGKITLI